MGKLILKTEARQGSYNEGEIPVAAYVQFLSFGGKRIERRKGVMHSDGDFDESFVDWAYRLIPEAFTTEEELNSAGMFLVNFFVLEKHKKGEGPIILPGSTEKEKHDSLLKFCRKVAIAQEAMEIYGSKDEILKAGSWYSIPKGFDVLFVPLPRTHA